MEIPPRISHVLETSLYVGDLQRSRDFYARILGFEEFLMDERLCVMGMPGGQVLLLFKKGSTDEPAPTPGGIIPAHHGEGQLHLCFAVAGDEMTAWERHLSRESIAVESEVHWSGGGRSLFFRDPDHHSLEIATPGLWPNY